MFRNKVIKNASWIIACKIVQSILGLIISMLTARYLGPSNFGLINYASSIVAFVAPIMYLGLTGVLVQEIINNPQREGETLGTAILMSFVSSIFCIAGIAAFVSVANYGEQETMAVCVLYSILLVFQSVEMITYWFQAKLKSKYPSIVSLCAYVIISVYKIYLLASGKSIRWFAVSNALDYMIIAFALIIVYYKIGNQKLSFSWNTAKSMFSKSRYYIVSNMMIAIFSQTDRIMLKIMVNDAATGYYSAAVTCAGMSGFIFSAIIDSFRPVIFDSKKTNECLYEKNLCRLYSIVIYMSLLQSVVVTILAEYIIQILYGSEFFLSIAALRVVVWYTTFSYLGAVRNIWILAENKQKYLWIINLSGALANIILNCFFIPVIGVVGAAVASLITQIFTNVMIGFILKPIRKNNKIMLKSLNPLVLLKR